jgi:hypothetical protein
MVHAPERDQWLAASTTQQVDIVTTGLDQAFVPHNRRRISLIISGPTSGTFTFTWGSLAQSNVGVRLAPNVPPIILSLDQNGSAVHGPIRLFASAAGLNVSYVETLCPPDCPDIRYG